MRPMVEMCGFEPRPATRLIMFLLSQSYPVSSQMNSGKPLFVSVWVVTFPIPLPFYTLPTLQAYSRGMVRSEPNY